MYAAKPFWIEIRATTATNNKALCPRDARGGENERSGSQRTQKVAPSHEGLLGAGLAPQSRRPTLLPTLEQQAEPEEQRRDYLRTSSGASIAAMKHTSRSLISRLLDAKDGNATLATLQRAAALLGRKVRLELI